MKRIQNNRRIILALSTVSLIVWGIIIYQVIRGLEYESESSQIKFKDGEAGSFPVCPPGYADSLFQTVDQIKDPFTPCRRRTVVKKKVSRNSKTARVKTQPPRIRYIGFISDKSGELVLLELENSETVFARTGDIIHEFKLKDISRDAVSVIKDNQVFEIAISR